MRKKEKIASDIISGIDDEIIEKNLIKRFQLWMPPTKKPKNNRWIPIVAAAACFCILLTTIFLLLPTGKQVPVYLGMTASSEAPVVSASVERANDYETLSLHSGSMLKATPILLKNDNGNLQVAADTAYAGFKYIKLNIDNINRLSGSPCRQQKLSAL